MTDALHASIMSFKIWSDSFAHGSVARERTLWVREVSLQTRRNGTGDIQKLMEPFCHFLYLGNKRTSSMVIKEKEIDAHREAGWRDRISWVPYQNLVYAHFSGLEIPNDAPGL